MIEVIKKGLLTTVQDAGRFGQSAPGIHPCGAMDRESFFLSNALVGNDDNLPALELHFPAGSFLFHSDAVIALTGAYLQPQLDGSPVPMNQPLFIPKGAQLSFERPNRGARTYLAVAGGFDIPLWLGSASTDLTAKTGGWKGRALQTGDLIPLHRPTRLRAAAMEPIYSQELPDPAVTMVVECLSGPECERVGFEYMDHMLGKHFQVGRESDRMGLRLRAEDPIPIQSDSIISSAVLFGTVQLLPNGEWIVLTADHPTTGGYPRILQIPFFAWGKLAQLSTGNSIRFQRIELVQAMAKNEQMIRENRQTRDRVRQQIQSYLS